MSKFLPADILLPDFKKVDGSKWATIACDQFTGEPEYWRNADIFVGEAPSTLRLMIPEAFLSETQTRVPVVNDTMLKYLEDKVLELHENSMVFIERIQADGRKRRGLVGMIDLEDYDYSIGSCSPIRATEGTVLSRIPPRVAIRKDAAIELPHIMMLVDDPENSIFASVDIERAPDYFFDLMLGGGAISGRFLTEKEIAAVQNAIDMIFMAQKDNDPLLFAVGDGNHSLATAKTIYEGIKEELGDAALTHPSRFALVELTNIYDEALDFEPIYRVLQNVDPNDVVREFKKYAQQFANNDSDNASQTIDIVFCNGEERIVIERPEKNITVATLQTFLDDYISLHTDAELDYIHGRDSLLNLARRERSIGFLFDGITKSGFFDVIRKDGAFPRKTFSMGHATDKRYYIECRKIK